MHPSPPPGLAKPDDPRRAQADAEWREINARLPNWLRSHPYNDMLGGQMLDNLENPSMTWLMTDANVIDPRLPAPHLGGYNVLFCDWLVKWLPADQVRQFARLPLPQAQGGQPGTGGAGDNGGAAADEDE